MGLTPLAWLAAGCGITAAAGITVVAAALTRTPDPADPAEGAGAAGGRAAPPRTGPVRRRAAGRAAPGHGQGSVADHRLGRRPGSRCGRAPGGRSPGWRWRWSGCGRRGCSGSGRVARDRIARLEALGAWCRRMADTLAGGGAIGLAQAIITSAGHAPDPIAPPVRRLAARLRAGEHDHLAVLAAFADELDDRVADQVAAALALALHQQSGGVARVLRQLADGVARDVRARRDIEAERAEARQSLRTLLLIQAGVLGAAGAGARLRRPLPRPRRADW